LAFPDSLKLHGLLSPFHLPFASPLQYTIPYNWRDAYAVMRSIRYVQQKRGKEPAGIVHE